MPASVCRGRAARSEAACPRVEAALRLIDPRKLYSILRPGSINRSIVNNPTTEVRYHWSEIHIAISFYHEVNLALGGLLKISKKKKKKKKKPYISYLLNGKCC